MNPSVFFTLFFLVAASIASGQSPFAKRLYHSANTIQEARRIIRTPDNHFLVVGYLTSSVSSLDRDALVFKMDEDGTVIWSKRYGGSNWEEFNDVVQVGSYYYCLGYTRTWVNGTYLSSGTNVNADVFLVKLNLNGSVVWAKNMGKPSNGNSATNGNDIGQRIVSDGQGGVVLTVRINSGQSTGQNNGIIRVDADGKTHWAYQYDITSNPNINELTVGIWKDGVNGYVTGGWVGPSSTGYNGGILFKVNQNGALLWDKNTRCSPGTFESQYYGYYNHSTGKIYTTDFYNQSSSSIREIQVCTNLASNGNVPPSGAIPQAKRFHYGSAGSAGNNYRSNIFPVGDGYQQFVLAAYDLGAITLNTTKYVSLVSADEDLNLLWTKRMGLMHTTNTGYLNQVNDLLSCDGSNQSILAVGTLNRLTGGLTYKDILISRVTATGTLNGCDVSAPINNSALSEDTLAFALQRVNLNTVGCGSNCWADNDLISGVAVTDVTLLGATPCATSLKDEGPSESAKGSGLDYIIPTITSVGIGNISGLTFSFLKQPKEVYFEITDPTGDFVYERFFGNIDKLIAGFDFASMNLEKREYIWEIEAVYDGEEGIERKVGEFVITQ